MKLFLITIIATALATFAGITLAAPVDADAIYGRQLAEDSVSTLIRRSPVSHFEAGNALGIAATNYHTAASLARDKANKSGTSPTQQQNLKAEQSRYEVAAHELEMLAKQHMAAHNKKSTMSDAENEKHLKRGEEELKKAKAAQEALRKT